MRRSGHGRAPFWSAGWLALTLALVWPPLAAGQPTVEEAPDPTRLDVERLPPEALEITRDMYDTGLFIQGQLGGRGFLGGVGRLSDPGPLGGFTLGYELATWLAVAGAFEVSLHESDAPAPPSPSTFQVLTALGELRLSVPLSTRSALWLGGQAGVNWSTGEYLKAYGLDDAGSLQPTYGGSLGFDWHLLNRHHAIGLLAGARLYPNLAGRDGEQAIGAHATAYLKYVF